MWIFMALFLIGVSSATSNPNSDREWRVPIAQLEMKVDRALRRLGALKDSQETTTHAPELNFENKRMREEISSLSGRLDAVQHTLEHKLLTQLDTLVDRLQKLTNNVEQFEATTLLDNNFVTTTDMPQGDHNLMHPKEPKFMAVPSMGPSLPTHLQSGIKYPSLVSEIEDNVRGPTRMPSKEKSEHAMNRLEENVRSMEQRILRKLNRLQKVMPTGEKEECANLLIPHLDKVEAEVSRGQRAIEQDVGVLRQLLNLELGVSLRAMQVDLQHCHKSTAELRDIMAETLTRRQQMEDLSRPPSGYLRDDADRALRDMSGSAVHKARRGATIIKDMHMDQRLGEGIATELLLAHPRSCAEVYFKGYRRSGIYTVWPTFNSTVKLQKYAYCDMDADGGGWTVFQRRGDFGSKQENFSRPWLDYKRGFGKVSQEFWLGNDAIHVLSAQEPVRLRIELEDWEGNRKVAQYDTFSVAGEADLYRLSVANFSGDLTDSFLYHDGAAFSTIDRNNAGLLSRQCVTTQGQGGGWWYNNCYRAKLNSPYKRQGSVGRAEGLQWRHWKGYEYSLKATEMKLRPACFPKMC